jgi:hypothetical protein
MVAVEILSSGRHTCEALKIRERRAVKSYLKKNILIILILKSNTNEEIYVSQEIIIHYNHKR